MWREKAGGYTERKEIRQHDSCEGDADTLLPCVEREGEREEET